MISGSVDNTVEYRRRDNYVYRLTVGEHLLVALHARSDEPLYVLTLTGAQLWERLGQWSTLDQLTDTLVTEYEVTTDAARQDVREFLDQLTLLEALDTRGAVP
ncbi:MAG TPA: PqqD family protein [Gemmatimonadaceae bacterium]|nr:PqqD family protein [Gemmatimonadaceae bacterium]